RSPPSSSGRADASGRRRARPSPPRPALAASARPAPCARRGVAAHSPRSWPRRTSVADMVTEGDRSHEVARRRDHMPEGTSAILDTRSLATDHRRLAELLPPGLAVLDVGCGTGAITRGVAEAVGRLGRVVGVDVNASMIEKAR